MNNGINELRKEFLQHRKVARRNNPSALPIINELEHVAISRANGKMSPSKARSRIKSCCIKCGINPMVVDHKALEPSFDFNTQKPGRQKNLNIKPVNLFAKSSKKDNPRARRRGLNFVDLFKAPASAPKKKSQYPAWGLQPKKGSSKINTLELKPMNFGNAPKRKTSRMNKSFKLKPIKLGKWF